MLSITRTCGGDPEWYVDGDNKNGVLPAHAGVILWRPSTPIDQPSITRTCGGDPGYLIKKLGSDYVLPAHAGVILD